MFNEQNFINEFSELVNNLEIKSAFEVGCFSGELKDVIDVEIVDGIDLNSQREDIVKGDFLTFKIRKKYDLVYSSGVLEHFSPDDIKKVLSKMASISKKYVLNIVPNSDCKAYLKAKSETTAEWKDELSFTLDELMNLHIEAGLTIKESGCAGQDWAKLFYDIPSEPYLVYVLAEKIKN